MFDYINFNNYPVNDVLDILLKNKATESSNKYIIFATNAYLDLNYNLTWDTQITPELIKNFDSTVIQPRVCKSREDQSERRKNNGEVFTPSWICNKMNNFCDEEWFGRKNVFNTEIENEHIWKTNQNKIEFSRNKNWIDYVELKRIEITCGEAPYLVSRYDTVTGSPIYVEDRIGLLDRKLRVIGENTTNESEWLEKTYTAFKRIYGYEFQGDNLLLARINLLMTFVEFMQHKWNRSPDIDELTAVANIISWNIWQMDGKSCSSPIREQQNNYKYSCDMTVQTNFSNFGLSTKHSIKTPRTGPLCKIRRWGDDGQDLKKDTVSFLKYIHEK